MKHLITASLLALGVVHAGVVVAEPAACYGRVAKGKLTGGVKLPLSGPNFSAYSKMAAGMGRTWVHPRTARFGADAYRAAQQTLPDVHFVYGETGLENGGRFRPHRSHQNGTSVDFFVPVRDRAGRSVPIPTDISMKFGYNIEFDMQGRYEQYRIDFPALAEHLVQLDRAARAGGAGIAQVIIEPAFMAPLLATRQGDYLKRNVVFMKGKPWIRHDEHYHVDFSIPCEKL